MPFPVTVNFPEE
ncbi:hypothetical protein CGLO_18209 [Colletotrichum gloeosporioides Cg-14]|uniref:Uncharacterized protein n=1 Tax=Colletotrichum gloeosporioides (strain Cg-14) TaxID=1237896 RepID=T0JIG1_COLGC|nr:hypothetical protein CGLO_18209 [Colletotrichum gloeosporioides Cg-14]